MKIFAVDAKKWLLITDAETKNILAMYGRLIGLTRSQIQDGLLY